MLNWALEVNESKLQTDYYIHFQVYIISKGISLKNPLAKDKIESQLFKFDNGFDIKKSTKVNMQLNNQNKTKLIITFLILSKLQSMYSFIHKCH